ncbi:MAG TPA: protein-L-isoaspartate(D-aspartate) O-methyltransferase [Phycisphaerae bacterium]|nr:protein-L-isoaspartate(D-aspartate) O-methyltransferase [Phycisphaerae bacterium]
MARERRCAKGLGKWALAIGALLLVAAALLFNSIPGDLRGEVQEENREGGPEESAPASEAEAPDRAPGEPSDPGETQGADKEQGDAKEEEQGAGEEEEVEEEEWSPPRFEERQAERDKMVRVIRAYGLADQAVLDAMAAVPRHKFVLAKHQSHAHDDTPLPIGYGQTISQPYIVAEMTRRLKLTKDSRVLEIGTGSGYQAAVLTEFTPQVYTIEIIKPLADSARRRLKGLGYTVVKVRHADGYYGWAEEAPFDAIIVTCAAGQIPPPLIKQLARGGRMVIPVGGPFATQTLMLVEKDEEGKVRSRSLMGVRFVPLRRRDVSE